MADKYFENMYPNDEIVAHGASLEGPSLGLFARGMVYYISMARLNHFGTE